MVAWMTGSRWPFRLLGVAMVGLVVAAAVVEAAGTVTEEWSWLVAAALCAFATCALLFLLRDRIGPRTATWLFAATGASAVVLYWTDPKGVALGMFVLGAMAPLREPRRVLLWVLAGIVVVFDVVQVASGHETVLTAVAIDAGVLFFALLGTVLLSERRRREQVAQLLVQVQAARAVEREVSALAERSRIARDIHDVLAHSLSALAISLEAARLQAGAPGTDPALRSSVERAVVLARDGLREAREAVGALRGDATPGPEMVPALVEEQRLATGAPATLTVTGQPGSLDREAGAALYRATQEGLSNIRKHAPGARADVHLVWTPDSVTLRIVNDLTRPTDSHPRSGWGLAGMRERADSIGAELTTDASDGHFTMALRVPRAGRERRGPGAPTDRPPVG